MVMTTCQCLQGLHVLACPQQCSNHPHVVGGWPEDNEVVRKGQILPTEAAQMEPSEGLAAQQVRKRCVRGGGKWLTDPVICKDLFTLPLY